MNARVFLLVLVTAAFMAVWDADRPAKNSVATNQAGLPHAAVSHAAVSASQKIASLIPLPHDLQSGTWHVFNYEGDTFHITVEHRSGKLSRPSGIASIEPKPENRVCVVTAADGIRWCFIKQPPQTAQQTESVTR